MSFPFNTESSFSSPNNVDYCCNKQGNDKALTSLLVISVGDWIYTKQNREQKHLIVFEVQSICSQRQKKKKNVLKTIILTNNSFSEKSLTVIKAACHAEKVNT